MDIQVGQSKTLSIPISKVGGYSAATTLTASQAADLTVTLTPPSMSGTGNLTAQLVVAAAANAANGTRSVVLSGNPLPSAPLIITVNVTGGAAPTPPTPPAGNLSSRPGPGQLTLIVDPQLSQSVKPGYLFEGSVNADGNGDPAPVQFQVGALPGGFSNFRSVSNVARRNQGTLFSVQVASSVAPGTYPITLRAVDNPANAVTCNVVVSDTGEMRTGTLFDYTTPPTWTFGPQPSSITLRPGTTGSVPLKVGGTIGGNGGLTLFFDSIPDGINVRSVTNLERYYSGVAAYSVWIGEPVAGYTEQLLEISVDAALAPGTYTLKLATNNGNTPEAASTLSIVVSNTDTPTGLDTFDYLSISGHMTNKVTTLAPGQAWGIVAGRTPEGYKGYFLTKNAPRDQRLYVRQVWPSGTHAGQTAFAFVFVREGTPAGSGEQAGLTTNSTFPIQLSLDNVNWTTITPPN